MTSPLYIQPGPSPTWSLSPAIWVTAQGDPSNGPKITNPIVGKPYTVWVEIQNFYPRRTPAAGTCLSVGEFRSPERCHRSLSGKSSTEPRPLPALRGRPSPSPSLAGR
jgi:hypothetical protein